MNHFFRLSVYISMLFMLAMIAIFLGCESAVCTDTFCLVPRDAVDGEVIEVDESKVLALIARDSQLVPAVETTPQTTPETTLVAEIETITVAQVYSDVSAGGTKYLNQTLNIQGYVVWRDDPGTAIVMTATGNLVSTLAFFILSDDALKLENYQIGTEYTIKVSITQIQYPNAEIKYYRVFSNLVE